MGGSVKSGPFLNARYAMYSISILYFTFYSYGGSGGFRRGAGGRGSWIRHCMGGAYVPNAPPPPAYRPDSNGNDIYIAPAFSVQRVPEKRPPFIF